MKTTLPREGIAALLIALGPACIDAGAIAGPSMGAGIGMTCQPCLKKPGCSDTSRDLPNLVSGLEAGCGLVDLRDGRDGGWFTIVKAGQSIVSPPDTGIFSDFAPSCEAANGSCYSACFTGRIAGPGYPYAGVGLTFHPGAFMYDLSRWRGVSFYVRGSVGLSSELHLVIPTAADTVLGIGSGTCDNSIKSCNDAYQIPVPGFTSGVSHDWEHKEISFASLAQEGFGDPEPWAPATAMQLQWEVVPLLESIQDDEFQVCVDQVELVP